MKVFLQITSDISRHDIVYIFHPFAEHQQHLVISTCYQEGPG